jgi:hypothetical protein
VAEPCRAPVTADHLLQRLRAIFTTWRTVPPSQQMALEAESRALAAQYVALVQAERVDARIAARRARRLSDPRHDQAAP